MPIHRGKTQIDGVRLSYYQYGNHGKKYTYFAGDKEGREKAYKKAEKQMKAIYSSRSRY